MNIKTAKFYARIGFYIMGNFQNTFWSIQILKILPRPERERGEHLHLPPLLPPHSSPDKVGGFFVSI